MSANKRERRNGAKWRKWSRIIHRDLSFFFSGVILIYAVSGFVLNHKRDFNAEYSIKQHTFNISGEYPLKAENFSEKRVKEEILAQYGETQNYTKHYFPDIATMKVFLKGGSSIVLDLKTGNGLYESVKKRPIIGSLNRLHYNPNRWWTVFSDIFAASLIIITITGLIMNKGKNGIKGRGGIEFALGIIIPIIFLFFT